VILQEQGKLSLDDELTKFLPNYPTHESFVKQHLFDRAGMRDSGCCSNPEIAPRPCALHSGKILGPAAYAEMIAPGTLNDGTELSYANGLQLRSSF